MTRSFIILHILVATHLTGCSAPTLEKATRDGAAPVNAREIYDLVSGNTLNLISYDFSGDIFFSESGAIFGRDKAGQKDQGAWDIKDNDSLCLRFQTWYYGDVRCYFITRSPDGDGYSFFTGNGSAYYQGSMRTGDSSGLEKEIRQKKKPGYLRSQFQGENPETPQSDLKSSAVKSASPDIPATTKDTSATVRQLAQDCPGCNFSRADLKEALLAGANLEAADLSGADLRYANLRRANLKGADLSNARLNHANLPGADLRGCNLRNADLSGANLLLADFTGAELSGAKFNNAYLEKTKGVEYQQ